MEESKIRWIIEIAVIKELAESGRGYYVPAAVSARHVHLCAADAETLFGKGYELRKRHAINQPGQYACEEVLTLEGPKGRLDVRVLGPVRKETQAEISMSDAIRLGIEPVIRMSGDIEGTQGGKLIGPKGGINLIKGVIVSARHLHLSAEEAGLFGLKNGDVVSVRKPGTREVVFGNVAVRAGEGHSLEVHMDTDEANAAGIKSGDILELIKSSGEERNRINTSPINKEIQVIPEPAIETMELITERDIKDMHKAGKKAVRLSKKGIITPLAKDTAKELEIRIEDNRG